MSVAQKTWLARSGKPMTTIKQIYSDAEGKMLTGKTALVTGSSRGIGKAIAFRLTGWEPPSAYAAAMKIP